MFFFYTDPITLDEAQRQSQKSSRAQLCYCVKNASSQQPQWVTNTAGRRTAGSNDEGPVHGRLRLTSIFPSYEGRRRMHYFALSGTGRRRTLILVITNSALSDEA